MAVVDKELYGNDSGQTIVKAGQVGGRDAIFFQTTVPVASGDSDTSVLRFAQVPSNFIPFDVKVNCTAITGLEDADIGLYECGTPANNGEVIDADALLDGQDLSSAIAVGSEVSGMTAIAVADLTKTFADIAGDSSGERQAYDLALTLNDDVSADGTVGIRMILINGA